MSALRFGGHELIDRKKDPPENTNLAGRPEVAQTVKELPENIRAHWRAALPRE